ncbi:lipopolysaccharide biosynthesis protein [Neobacillus niacini]|uniref:lipopolysaccharide biosynthesis protein n=1 Tax=Neobacillus niacini TaxID=86668 RepID=UPI001C8E415F|nr:oligosaccharide flippase family protein [Neobacillus niacini]MBY0145116.1 oligosaccharide flippase family protein [Neobacillus niacini]
MKRNIIELSKKPFIRNVLIMATGTAAAQAVSMALSPIITRLYGPEAFGLLGAFTAVIGIISPIAALTYPIAVVLPKSDNDAKGLIRLSIYISACFAMIVAITLIVLKQPIVRMFNIESIAPFLYLLPLVTFFSALEEVTEYWLIRTKQFRITAKVTILQSFIINGSKVGLGFFHPLAAGLIILTVIGQFLRVSMMILFAKGSNIKQELEGDNAESLSIKELAKKHKDFPLFRAPQVFLNAVSQGLPILMLTSFFGPASAGFYSLGRTVLSIPSQLIGKSVGDVFYPRISEAANKGEDLTLLIKRATLSLGAIGIIPYGIVIIFGPWLFGFVFGSDWIKAGEYARWIALWVFFMFINQPSVKALPVLSAQSFHLKFTFITLITRIALLALGYYVFLSDIIAIALFGVSGAILNIILILFTLQKSKKLHQ